MKIRISHILLIGAFLFSAASYSQVNRRIGQGQYKRAKKEKQNTDFVQQSVDYLTVELKLDDFQKAAVREIIEDERDAINALHAESKDITTDEVRDRTKAISDRIYKKVLSLLSKDQAAIYTKMEESKKF